MCCVSAAEAKEDSCHSGMLNLASMEEQSSLHSEGSFEVTWDWPQEPFELSQEAETEQQLLQDVGEASCSSVQLPEAALEASRSVKVCIFPSSSALIAWFANF
jgi:hypothetical protein